jgi:hypothetical protein
LEHWRDLAKKESVMQEFTLAIQRSIIERMINARKREAFVRWRVNSIIVEDHGRAEKMGKALVRA